MPLTVPTVSMYGFTPVFVECTSISSEPILEYFEWNGSSYDSIIASLRAENENGTGFFNISALPLFDVMEGLPTFDQTTTPTGLVKKIKVKAIESSDDSLIGEIGTFAIYGAYPSYLDFEQYDQTKFLSHQPRTQTIYEDQPIWLYYFVKNRCQIRANFAVQYNDDTTANHITNFEIYEAGEMIAFNINEYKNSISGVDVLRLVFNIEVAEYVNANTLTSSPFNSEDFTFNVQSETPDWGVQHFLFFDKFGAMVTLPVKGKRNKKQSVTRQLNKRAVNRAKNSQRAASRATHQTIQTNTEKQVFETSTGWLEDAEYYQSLFSSEFVWLIDTENNEFIAVNIEGTTFDYGKDFENLIHIEFAYSFKSFNYYHP